MVMLTWATLHNPRSGSTEAPLCPSSPADVVCVLTYSSQVVTVIDREEVLQTAPLPQSDTRFYSSALPNDRISGVLGASWLVNFCGLAQK
jgi:hypothetical protein